MIYLAYIVLVFTVLQLLITIVNLLFKQKPVKSKISRSKLVSVLIPARNEEKNIVNLISNLQRQDYHNIEIIVFDDQSTDKTAEIVSELSKGDTRIQLIRSGGLPSGWLGKNYACHKLSEQAKGFYYLFLDADVSLKKDIISAAIAYTEKYQLGLLSVFPVQEMGSTGERITVPLMNYILLSLLPLILVRKSRYPSLAAANGQFMLFHSAIYNNIHPHVKMKNNRVEDIAIARYYKMNKIRIACLTSYNTLKCKMYENFSEAVNGFSKNIIAYFGNSFPAALIFWVITTFGFLSVLFSFPLYIFFFYLLSIMLIRIITSCISRQNVLINLIFMIPQQLVMGLILWKALIQQIRNQYEWKGRYV